MKYVLPIIALLIFLGSITSSYSQNNYDYSTYNQEQGLSSSTFSIILKDPAGFIWIGSERGLNRFDGYDFKTYYESNAENTSKSLTAILSMQINSIGTVLIRTINSICLLDKKRGTYSPILSLNSRSEFANLHQFNNKFLLIKDKEIIYFDKYGKLTNTLNVPIKHFNNFFSPVIFFKVYFKFL
jgi:ligand-binding sensor domain-containing protein